MSDVGAFSEKLHVDHQIPGSSHVLAEGELKLTNGQQLVWLKRTSKLTKRNKENEEGKGSGPWYLCIHSPGSSCPQRLWETPLIYL